MHTATAQIPQEQHIFNNNNNCSEVKKKKTRRRRGAVFTSGKARQSRHAAQVKLRAQMYPFPLIFHIHHLSPAQVNHQEKQARVPSAARTHKLKAGTGRESAAVGWFASAETRERSAVQPELFLSRRETIVGSRSQTATCFVDA